MFLIYRRLWLISYFTVVEVLLDKVDTTHIVWNIDVFKIRLKGSALGRR